MPPTIPSVSPESGLRKCGALALSSAFVKYWGLIGVLFLGSCSSVPGFGEPRVTLLPVVALLDVEGKTSMQSPAGPTVVNNGSVDLRDLGVGDRSSETGGALRMGDGFSGLDVLFLNIDNSSSRSGTLAENWGNLLSGDQVNTQVEGNEFRLRYIAQMFGRSFETEDEEVVVQLGAGGVLAHRELKFQATTTNGVRAQSATPKDDGVLYLAGRGSVAYRSFGLVADLAISPSLNIGGDFDGTMWDLELMGTYTLEDQDLTAFVGWRRSEMSADGTDGGFRYDLDLTFDGYFMGLELSF